MQGTLVAGLWGTGVSILPGELGRGAPPSMTMTGCEVRNCYHRCITIATGCNDVRIERSRISGSAWHGIRYDNASPVIEHNLIFANARSGIYASGDTRATVRGNVIFANEMNAVSCWFSNHDEFTGNTFVANLREGISVLGASKPTFKRNLFALNPQGLQLGMINAKGANAQALGEAVLKSNVFWQNDVPVMQGSDKKQPEGTNRTMDPGFVNAATRSFALRADSALRSEVIGAADPISLASPWPLQAEEKAMIPATDTRDYSQWQQPGQKVSISVIHETQAVRAREAATTWVKDALQLEDKAKRHDAVEAIRTAFGSSNPERQLTGLSAFNRINVVEFDRSGFRALLLPLLEQANPHISTGACRALRTCGLVPEDHARFLKLAQRTDPIVQQNIIPYLLATAPRPLDQATQQAVLIALSPAVIDTLRTGSTEDSYRQTMRALGEVALPMSIKTRLNQLCEDRTVVVYRLAFFYALAPQKQKAEADIQAVAKFLAHEDTKELVPRALWSLSIGVTGEQRKQTADILVRFLEARSDSKLREQALKTLLPYADKSHATFCQLQLARSGLPAVERKLLEQMVSKING